MGATWDTLSQVTHVSQVAPVDELEILKQLELFQNEVMAISGVGACTLFSKG